MADLEKLFEDNRSFVFKFLLKLCQNASLAEELTQETFFRAYMNIEKLRDESKAASWLCQIAKHSYFAWYQESKKIYPLEEAQALPDAFDVAEFYLEKELSQQAFACLNELEEPYKDVLMLSVFGDLSLKEISQLYGKSESWARVTFYRAKQKLIERMR